jgi:hypothetical protein
MNVEQLIVLQLAGETGGNPPKCHFFFAGCLTTLSISKPYSIA